MRTVGQGASVRGAGRRRVFLAVWASLVAIALFASACTAGSNSGPDDAADTSADATATASADQLPTSVAPTADPTGDSATGPTTEPPTTTPPTTAPTTTPPAPPTVAYAPKAGATDADPLAPATVTVSAGTIKSIALHNAAGYQVEGTLSGDRHSYKTAEPLGYGKTYTWSGQAVGAEGQTTAIAGKFTVLQPSTVLRATLNIGDDQVVGVAAPIIVTFYGHVQNRAAAEKALSVKTSTPTEGAWAWLPDADGQSRVHWRPKDYYQAGTTVTVTAKLYGVDYGGGAFGKTDITSTFKIGRAQVAKGDADAQRLKVYVDGKLVHDFPASFGSGATGGKPDPNRITRSGIHVVMEKFKDKIMRNPPYYEEAHEKWAVRISNNGEFVHLNPKNPDGTDGYNVTHGCINLSVQDAQVFFNAAIYGDPVEVTGTSIKLSAADGDIYDWAVPWSQWKSMSALR